MEWSRVKSILICVFVVVNLMLMAVYIKGNSTQTVTDDKTIENCAKILADKNIIIDKSIIPKKVSDASIYAVTNKYKTVGDYAAELYKRAKEAGLSYFDPAATTEQDNALTYVGKADTISNIKKNLKKIGVFDNYKTKCTQSETEVIYNVMCDGLYVYDCYVKASVKGEVLTITVKNWLCDSYRQNGFSPVKSATEALISFSNAVSFDTAFKVTEVVQGYACGNRNNEIQTTTSIPVWKITGETGASYYVDMRNGDFLSL